jgi:HD-GYP domain-containing protein (c-di-GMP phosphodiesterase class II)
MEQQHNGNGGLTLSLRELVEEIIANLDKYNLDDCLEDIGRNLNAFLGAERTYFFLLEPNSNELSVAKVVGLEAKLDERTRIRYGEGLAGWVAQNKEAVTFLNIDKDPDSFARVGDRKNLFLPEVDENTRSIVCMPLVAFESLIGVVEIQNIRDGDSDRADFSTLQPLVNIAALAIPRRVTDESFVKLAEICVRFLEEKDPYTHGHSIRVMRYSMLLADKINLSTRDKGELRICSLLHDIGKVIVKDSLLRKKGRLTVSEYETVKMHPTIGSNITGKISKSFARKILSHHERWDGKGYPEGLKERGIPLVSRIIAIADAFDAMTSARPYRDKWNADTAVTEIKNNSGTQFDPVLVENFVELFEEGLLDVVKV